MLVKEETGNQNIAIVGAGIIGLAIGLKLQQQGHQVTLFDPNGVGNGCSKGNAGHIATEQVFPLATPGLIPQLPKMLLNPKSPVSIRWQDLPSTMGWMLRFLSKAKPSST
ncbi:FAD-dependent oxidoreductase, partial [Vibrio harveyi]